MTVGCGRGGVLGISIRLGDAQTYKTWFLPSRSLWLIWEGDKADVLFTGNARDVYKVK